MKQTAVNWLINELHKKQNGDGSKLSFNQIFDKAREMEREQIIYFHIETMKKGLIHEGEAAWNEGYLPKIKSIAESNYTKTYGKKFLDLVSPETSQVHDVVKKLKEKKNNERNNI